VPTDGISLAGGTSENPLFFRPLPAIIGAVFIKFNHFSSANNHLSMLFVCEKQPNSVLRVY
jgi:hypothetical protein